MYQPTDPRFFTHNWTITLPTHPSLKFIRQTPLNIAQKISIKTNPQNDPLNENPTFTPEKIAEIAEISNLRYQTSKTKHNALELLVINQETNSVIGSAGTYQVDLPVKERLANIGIVLNPEVRRMGVGEATLRVLLRLSSELDVDVVHAGTMKSNVGMRKVARKLGWKEREEVLEIPGRGIVAEILFEELGIERWRGLEWVVEWGEEGV